MRWRTKINEQKHKKRKRRHKRSQAKMIKKDKEEIKPYKHWQSKIERDKWPIDYVYPDVERK